MTELNPVKLFSKVTLELHCVKVILELNSVISQCAKSSWKVILELHSVKLVQNLTLWSHPRKLFRNLTLLNHSRTWLSEVVQESCSRNELHSVKLWVLELCEAEFCKAVLEFNSLKPEVSGLLVHPSTCSSSCNRIHSLITNSKVATLHNFERPHSHALACLRTFSWAAKQSQPASTVTHHVMHFHRACQVRIIHFETFKGELLHKESFRLSQFDPPHLEGLWLV